MPAAPPPYRNNDQKSFAYTSARKRWPTILTQAIDDLSRAIGALPADTPPATVAEGKALIQPISALLYDLDHDRRITPFDVPSPTPDALRDLPAYNADIAQLAPGQDTWLTAPWLVSECVLYRRLALVFQTAESDTWRKYDVFGASKLAAFASSQTGVVELATRYAQLASSTLPSLTAAVVKSIRHKGPAAAAVAAEPVAVLQELFREFVDVALWGNATDLSLLTNVKLEDIHKLQGNAARQANEANVLANDTADAWDAVFGDFEAAEDADDSPLTSQRVDFVLDNAGFELYSDLIFALFLLDSGLVKTVVLHPKSIPWFVSDVVPHDILDLVQQLQDPAFFKLDPESDARKALDFVGQRLEHYLGQGQQDASGGQIVVRTNPFWTTHLSFRDDLGPAGRAGGALAWEDLKDATLVFFKGDLNHRKLLGDLEWPRSTSFLAAIGPTLAASGVRLITLRTVKADVVVGLPEGKDTELAAAWARKNPDSGDDGRGWAYSGKWAVVQYSEGAM